MSERHHTNHTIAPMCQGVLMYNHSGRYDGMGHPLTQAVCLSGWSGNVGEVLELEKLLFIYIYISLRIQTPP